MDRAQYFASFFSAEKTLRDSIEALDLILAQDKQLRPTWHPLGFMHVLLGKTAQQTFRLHIWLKNDRRYKKPNWPIHNHIYDLQSRVIYGAITNREYLATADRHGEHLIYEAIYTSSGSYIRPTNNKIKLRESQSSTYGVGARYAIGRGTFHESVVPPEILAATIVCISNFSEEQPLIAGDIEAERKDYHFQTLEVPNAILREALTTIRANIQLSRQ